MLYQFNAFLTLIITLLVTSCSTLSKSKQLVDFTPKLHAETPQCKITLPPKTTNIAWEDNANFVNTLPLNFSSKSSLHNFQEHKLSDSIISAPIIAGDKAFALTKKGEAIAYQLPDFKKIWAYNITDEKTNEIHTGSIVHNQGKLYITNNTQLLVVLDSNSGYEILRRYFYDSLNTEPSVANKKVYLQNTSNILYALDKETGAILWRHEGQSEELVVENNNKPIIFNNTVLTSYSSGQVAIINSDTGQIVWQFTVGRHATSPTFPLSNLATQPIISDNKLYLATNNGYLAKFNLADKTKIWKRNFYNVQTMTKVGSSLFITNDAHQAAAVDTTTGKIIWTTEIMTKKGNKRLLKFLPPMVINDQVVIITTDGKLYKLASNNGQIIDTLNLPKDVISAAIVSEHLYIFTTNKVLVF